MSDPPKLVKLVATPAMVRAVDRTPPVSAVAPKPLDFGARTAIFHPRLRPPDRKVHAPKGAKAKASRQAGLFLFLASDRTRAYPAAAPFE